MADTAADSDPTDVLANQLLRLQQAGVELDALAMQALANLPPEHASDLLEYVAENHGYLRNPSKYISSTVARGFVPRRGGPPGPGAVEQSAGAWSAPNNGAGGGVDRLLARAQEAGLVLSPEAVSSLSGLPAEHAAELLEFVLDKHTELRDPSNYIASTVARGFKSRRGVAGPTYQSMPTLGGASGSQVLARSLQRMRETGVELDDTAKQALSNLPPEHAAEMVDYVVENHTYLRNPSNYVTSTVARGFVPRRGGPAGPGKAHSSMVPADVTPLERRVLQLNSALSSEIDLTTYLALRCLPLWQATELLDSLEAKSAVIASPCNYIQAAVSKIQRGQGWHGGGPPGGGAPAGGWGPSAGAGGGGTAPGGAKQWPGAVIGASPAGGAVVLGAAGGPLKRQRMW